MIQIVFTQFIIYHNISRKRMSHDTKQNHDVTYYPIQYQIMIQYHKL